MTMKKTLALLVCVCLLLAVLAGCGSGTQTVEYTDDELAAQAAQAEQNAQTSQDAAAADTAEDTAEILIGTGGTGIDTYPLDTVVATVNGDEITWEEYYYWLYYWISTSLSAASSSGLSVTGWDASGELSQSATQSNAEAVIISAQAAAAQDHIYEQEAAEQGLTLASGEISDEVEQNVEYTADQYYGDQDGTATEEELAALDDYFASIGITSDFMRYQIGTQVLANESFIAQYGENGTNYPDDAVAAYVDEEGLMHAKHIMLLTIDTSTGEALDEDTCAEKYATAQDLLSQLQAVQDDPDALNALFDELMNTYSEDTGLSTYPDGYIFAPGEMVEAFEIATENLDVNYGLSDIVQSDYGYHIILRMPVSPDDMYGTSYTVRCLAANAAFNDHLTELYNTADIQWNDEFTDLDMQAIFG